MLHSTDLDSVHKDFTDTVGWPGLADQVAAVSDGLTPEQRRHAVILASNYGEAGALDLYGPARGLPPVICARLTYSLWKPTHVDDSTVIVVGYSPEYLSPYFGDVRQVASITVPMECRARRSVGSIVIASQPRVPLDRAWPDLQALS